MRVGFRNRYGSLREVILCYPVHFRVEKREINRELMFEQYNNFINVLSEHDVITYFLDPKYGISQVFTRDIAFVVDDIFFVGKMKATSRREEFRALDRFILEKDLRVRRLSNFIEGGDVVLHDNLVFVGVSTGTSMEGIEELQRILFEEGKDYKVVPIRFNKEEMLHLDCVFNVVNKDACVITDYVYDDEVIRSSFKRCYHIEDFEAKRLAANLISIGNNTVISSSRRLCSTLSEDGIRAIYVDYSEIIKGGGAFTCTTLPVFSKKE